MNISQDSTQHYDELQEKHGLSPREHITVLYTKIVNCVLSVNAQSTCPSDNTSHKGNTINPADSLHLGTSEDEFNYKPSIDLLQARGDKKVVKALPMIQ